MIDPKRRELMSRGVEELKTWLLDMLREGLAALASAPPDYWESLAARMVDAKLGSIARRIRAWPALLALPDGEKKLIEEIGVRRRVLWHHRSRIARRKHEDASNRSTFAFPAMPDWSGGRGPRAEYRGDFRG